MKKMVVDEYVCLMLDQKDNDDLRKHEYMGGR